jgi:hypothetical protein
VLAERVKICGGYEKGGPDKSPEQHGDTDDQNENHGRIA